MVKLVNRAKVTTSTTGTGTMTLDGAQTGYQTFALAGVVDGDVVSYVIEDGAAWEIGSGTYTASGTTLSRSVSESSAGGAAISLSGNAAVFATAIASDLQNAADMDQGVATTDSPEFAAITVNGNVTVTGTVDGRDVAADGSKLDGIEAGATADQTAAEIKTAYESNANTNAFTDDDAMKLDGIEAGATADQTAAEIKTAYESNANTNAFTDDDAMKLDGIEALADVTDTTNVTAAGALMDSELTSIAAVKALDQGVATTDSPSFAGGTFTGDLTISDKIIHAGDTDTAIRFPAADTFSVETAGVEQLRVASNGNVGIGTNSPAQRLDVAGSITTTGGTINKRGVYLEHQNNISASFIGRSENGLVDTRNRIKWNFNDTSMSFDVNGSERLRVTSAGNVGIGTSAPSEKLDVNGSVNVTGGIAVDGLITMPAATTQARSIELGTGRTGDGTSFLDLIGDATYTDYGARLIRNAGANATSLLTHRGTGGLIVQSQDAGFVAIQTTATERMRVDPSGNVLIGTSATGASKLRVVGLPTSSAGLSAGDVWNDGGTLKIA